MRTNNNSQERRQYTRFPTKKGVIIVLDSKSGELIDISFGGISFRYLGQNKWPTDTIEGIFFGNDDLCWLKIPLRTITDEIILGNQRYNHTKEVRRHSMAFGDLAPQQTHQLMDFIQNNTI